MLLKCNRKFLECDKNERSVKHTLPEGTLCYALPKRLFVVKLYVFLIKKTDIFQNGGGIFSWILQRYLSCCLSVNVRFVCQTAWLCSSQTLECRRSLVPPPCLNWCLTIRTEFLLCWLLQLSSNCYSIIIMIEPMSRVFL